MAQSPVGFLIVAVVIPLLSAIAVIGSEALTAPNLAEHHDRQRTPGERRERIEARILWGIVIVIAIVFVVAIIDLLLHRSPF